MSWLCKNWLIFRRFTCPVCCINVVYSSIIWCGDSKYDIYYRGKSPYYAHLSNNWQYLAYYSNHKVPADSQGMTDQLSLNPDARKLPQMSNMEITVIFFRRLQVWVIGRHCSQLCTPMAPNYAHAFSCCLYVFWVRLVNLSIGNN